MMGLNIPPHMQALARINRRIDVMSEGRTNRAIRAGRSFTSTLISSIRRPSPVEVHYPTWARPAASVNTLRAPILGAHLGARPAGDAKNTMKSTTYGSGMAESSGEISNTSDLFETLAQWNDELKRLGVTPGNMGVFDEGVPHG